MSLSQKPVEERRKLVSSFSLTIHVQQRFRYENENRCISKQIISDAIQQGDRRDNPGGDADTAIYYTTCGITFKVAVDTITEEVVTAYPVKFDRMEAIKSNRWTQPQIESVQQRVREGKTKMV
jgi:sarcosine oxidase delta subunit